MGRSSLKDSKPIRLPCDGTLLYHLSTRGVVALEENVDDKDKCAEASRPDEDTKAALKVLQYLTNRPGIEQESRCLSLDLALLSTLIHAASVKDQLHALQTYRCHLLHVKAAITEQTTAPPDTHGKGDNFISDVSLSVSALYYILLEWSLSLDAPAPLRRALQLLLDTLSSTSLTTDDGDNAPVVVMEATERVVASLLTMTNSNNNDQCTYWKDPLGTLKELLTYAATHEILVQTNSLLRFQVLQLLLQWSHPVKAVVEKCSSSSSSKGHSNHNDDNERGGGEWMIAVWDQAVLDSVQRGVQIANLCKTVLTTTTSHESSNETDVAVLIITEDQMVVIAQLRSFLWSLLKCQAIPVEHLLLVGIALSRMELLGSTVTTTTTTSSTTTAELTPQYTKQVHRVLDQARDLQDVNRAALLNGMAATVAIDVLFSATTSATTATTTSSTTENDESSSLCPQLVQLFCELSVAADLDVRYLAIKGIRTLVSRCNSFLESPSSSSSSSSDDCFTTTASASTSCSKTADISCSNDSEQKRCALIVASNLLERALEVALQAWENPSSRKVETSIPPLFREALTLSRKQGAHVQGLVQRLLEQPPNRKGRYVALETLLPETSAESLFSSELCEHLLSGVADSGHNTVAIADLWAKLLQQLLKEMATKGGCSMKSQSQGRRPKQQLNARRTAESNREHEQDQNQAPESWGKVVKEWLDLWIPSLATALLSSDQSRRKQVASFCLPRIVLAIGGPSFRPEAALAFRLLLLECQQSSGSASPALDFTFAAKETSQDCLLWAQLQTVCFAESEGLLDSARLGEQARQLKESVALLLPSERLRSALVHFSVPIRTVAFEAIEATVNATSESASIRFQRECDLWTFALPYAQKHGGKEYVTTVLHRLLSFMDRLLCFDGMAKSGPHDVISTNGLSQTSLLHTFSRFLLRELVVQRGSYPGTTIDKEVFSVSLLESLLVFHSRDHSLALGSKLVPKTGSIFERRRTEYEEELLSEIRRELLGEDVVSSLLSLLHSIWDNTRSSAYLLLTSVIKLRHLVEVDLPPGLSEATHRQGIERRAIFLASSPRQREADTGARLLAILYLSATDQEAFLERLVDLLERRIDSMKTMLDSVLRSESDVAVSGRLPLANGIVLAVRLVLEMEELRGSHGLILLRIASLLCRAIETSLAVVADLRETAVDGVDVDFALVDGCGKSGKPAVNPGAIGANGIFSSVKRSSDHELSLRLASQRIVVGAWLLTKETCNALSILLSTRGLVTSLSLFDESGSLLLSTLTSLKHAGAAFGSHRAIQHLSETCLTHIDPSIQQLPSKWMMRLLQEVSGSDRVVRNSILRRSTGYALGFLSIMRSEVSMRVPPRVLCRFVLTNLLRLSLPPRNQLEELMKAISFEQSELRSLFCFLSQDPNAELIADSSYEVTARIHALNILRAVILDAPLSQEVFPMAGDAIASAVLGYVDPLWAVRNSATMVFSCAMLRVIDADKNASNTDRTSSRAITVVELFRSYPKLPLFLRLVLDGAVAGTLPGHASQSLPPALPILLLFARVQPAGSSGSEAEAMVAPFWLSMLANLGHVSLLVRKAAARALVNLSCNDGRSSHSSLCLLNACVDALSNTFDWNRVHGSLLTIHLVLERKGLLVGDDARTSLLRENLHTLLGLRNGKPAAPPSCMSIGLKILLLVDFHSESDSIETLSYQIKAWLESSDRRAFGVAELGTTVGFVATSQLCPRIWSTDVSVASLRQNLQRLSALLQSPVYDVRLAAIKAFKKSIYAGLDGLQGRVDKQAAKQHVDAIVELLVSSLECEINRNRTDEVGAHPPSLRRLSRCLIESLLTLLNTGKMALAQDLRKRALNCAFACLNGGVPARGESATVLTGNGLELLAMTMRGWQTDADVLDTFQKLIVTLSDPNRSWRLRHSAAVALLISGILDGDGDRITTAVRRELTLAALRLSQDSDEDVRHVGTKVLAAFLIVRSCETEAATVTVPMPEVALRELDDAILCEVALASACGCSKGLEENLKVVLGEFEVLRSSGGLDAGLVNVNTGRKIFEEETPSSYMEPSLITQTSLAALVRRAHSHVMDESEQALAHQVLDRCRAVLSQLHALYVRAETSSPFYDVTKEAKVMPLLHNLLLGSAAVLLLLSLNEVITREIQQSAQALLQEASSSSRPMCKAIRQVLQVMAEEADRDGFLSACYLL